jgi:cytochrome P450
VDLTVGEQTFSIPPDTRIVLSTNGSQTLKRYWGNDSLKWKPRRWVLDLGTNSEETGEKGESLFVPARGSFFAWSDGVRTCPGKKFSQVEFVAAMVALFRDYKVDVVPEKGETHYDARERVKRTVNDNAMVLLLQMRDPKSVGLKWSAR